MSIAYLSTFGHQHSNVRWINLYQIIPRIEVISFIMAFMAPSPTSLSIGHVTRQCNLRVKIDKVLYMDRNIKLASLVTSIVP